MKLTQEQEVEFLLKQFSAHVGKIERTQAERFNRLRLAIAGTFAYYAWLITAEDHLPNAPILMVWAWCLPIFVNGLGRYGNRHLKETIRNHASVIQRIIKDLDQPNRFLEEVGSRPHSGRHPTDYYWSAMVYLSVLGLAFGMLKLLLG